MRFRGATLWGWFLPRLYVYKILRGNFCYWRKGFNLH